MKTSLSLAGGLALMCCINAVPTRAQIAPLPTPMAANASVADRSKALNALFDEIWQDKLKHSPEYASYLGDKRYNDQLTDYSVQAINASLARGRGYIERLGMIDTTGLPDQEKLSAELMMRSLIDDQEAAKFKEWEMPVNQFSGFHTDLAQMPNDLPFDTVKDYDDYISRLHKVPTAFSQITTNMQMGIDEGRMPPEYLLEKVLVQVQTLADQKPEDSPFALPLKKFPKTVDATEQKRISGELLNAIATDVLPSYQRFAKFMKVDYVPKGRKDPGVWALPDGDAYYAFRIRQSTTLNKSAAEIHQIGLDEVKRDETEMLAIVHKLGFADLKSFNAALKTNPKEHPTSKEQLIDAYKGYIAQMQPKLPELFGTLPKAKLEVVEMPSYIAKDQAEAFYDQGSADGKRPGKVDVNTYNFAERSLAGVEAVAYHEGIPGHHLQISIAQELTGLPEFRKQNYYTAYTEGWALYSERLGKEIGFYQDPYSDYGRLEADIWRAIRLVVDTGVHSQHWTRQQMIDYFHEHTAMDDTNIQAEVDRYIAWPGQALGYKMGQLKILELRDRAKTALGSKFDIKAFHDEVLDSGALPMDVLDQRVNDWIAAQKKVAN
ncbi:X-Pro dipeptidyl-peptidase [Edaphobacter dinghuensis]|uniref:X-Pro dipeptidyl-peptidase n=2 Tax=Edaphobacter dinghuensis TaxID=1560005 RepID=A0A917H8J8_9BACT|nr:X-Pro dipeptidyl-peptidase [Edaphobacter dinghuensis]